MQDKEKKEWRSIKFMNEKGANMKRATAKIITILLMITMATAITGCSDQNETTESSEALASPWDLQKSLIAEIEELLAQMQLKNAAGEDVVGVKGYEQRLPEITYDEEDQLRFFPYFIVRIEEGNTPTDDEPWLVGTTVLFGICDYDKETNGHRTILEMITKITNRFLERPLLDSKFRANQNVSFALQDEDTYPFYFGAIDIKFYVPKIGRSDDWS